MSLSLLDDVEQDRLIDRAAANQEIAEVLAATLSSNIGDSKKARSKTELSISTVMWWVGCIMVGRPLPQSAYGPCHLLSELEFVR